MDFSLATYILLTFSAFLAGLVDTVAGGGGLISLPALLTTGMPPALALGTNKLQSSFGTLTSALYFIKRGYIKLSEIWLGILYTILGASIGTILVQYLHADFLSKCIPFLLLAILIYTIKKPSIGDTDATARLTHPKFYLIFGLGIGFYDGFFGPGTGSFWIIAFILLLGFNLKTATMHTKVFNFTSNVIALIWFALGSKVIFTVGLTMAVGQFLGAKLGAYLVVHKGTRFIRPCFITMVAIMTGVLFYQNY